MDSTDSDDPSPSLGHGAADQQMAGAPPPTPALPPRDRVAPPTRGLAAVSHLPKDDPTPSPSTRMDSAEGSSCKSQQTLRIAVLGATGLVGREMLRLLETSEIEIGDLRLLGSSRSQSLSITFRGKSIPVQAATHELLNDVDVVLASAGGSVSREFLPRAAQSGAVCIDNTSAFRMDQGVPLVVPEVNGHELQAIGIGAGGAIIANPNCSTIQLVAALKPLHDVAGLRRVIVSTYQSVSGAGQSAIRKFESASQSLLAGCEELEPSLKGTAAFDLLPVIGDLDSDGHSTEELKMMHETSKILGSHVDLDVCCVRVPVVTGHAEAVLADFHQPLSPEQATRALRTSPGVIVQEGAEVPTPRAIAGKHSTYVGRVRAARTLPNALQMWVVADNLLKGAALNAVQILESLTGRIPPSIEPSKIQTQSRVQS
jgi:aspartate-semialdehyde dehydrogenase